MPRFQRDGFEIAYRVTGPSDGPILLLSHCLAGDSRLWEPQIRALGDRFRIMSYDLRGHGDSSVGSTAYAIDDLAADALALLDHLSIERAHFVGLSLGGMIGQALAAAAPERLGSLVLCACASSVPPPALWEGRIALVAREGVAALVPTTLERWFSDSFRNDQPDAVERVAHILRETPAEGYIRGAQAIARADLSAAAKTIRTPTLIIYGGDDTGIRRAWAEEMHGNIASSRLIVLPGLRHHPNLEGAELVNGLISQFIDEVEGAFAEGG